MDNFDYILNINADDSDEYNEDIVNKFLKDNIIYTIITHEDKPAELSNNNDKLKYSIIHIITKHRGILDFLDSKIITSISGVVKYLVIPETYYKDFGLSYKSILVQVWK